MKKNTQKKKSPKPFHTLLTVLVTVLVISVAGVFWYGWHTLGFSSYAVSYSSSDSDVIGKFPEKRNFEAGEEVVVRAGAFSRPSYKFIGWKDVNGVIESTGGTLENGTVFIMPKNDVVLEAVWEEENNAEETVSSQENTSPAKKDSAKDKPTIFIKKENKDYINVRSSYGYDSEVVTKISDSDTEIEYSGKSENLYDEDDLKTYTWYFVNIPSLNKEGWIRSDMLTELSDSSDSNVYLMSSKYNSVTMYEDPDTVSDAVEKITDNETSLYFLGETDKSKSSDGDTVEWYLMENNESGKTGWVQKDRLQKVE